MAKKIVGLDLDGVFCNWNDGARPYFAEQRGKDLCTATTPDRPTWNWPKHYGYTDEECKKAYAAMADDRYFWGSLEPLPYAEEALHELDLLQDADKGDVYFITTRPGKLAKFMTECWISGVYPFAAPTVLIAMSPQAKGLIAAGLGLTHFIDDRAENCLEVRRACPQTQVFCLSAGWNLEYHEALLAAGVKVVVSLAEFIKEVTND